MRVIKYILCQYFGCNIVMAAEVLLKKSIFHYRDG